jgi:DNA polymerase-3 subunit alpha
MEKLADGTGAIRFGLLAVKNVGAGAIEGIVKERDEGGDYKSIEDLCRRANLSGVNKRVMESLIKVGALDCLSERGTLMANIASIMSLAQRVHKMRQTGQTTMFDLWGEKVDVPIPSLAMVDGEVSIKDKLGWEKELLGVYLSEHPFSPFVAKAALENTTLCGRIDADLEGQMVAVAGMVDSVRSLVTRDGQPSASVILEDLDGRLEVMVWPRVYSATQEFWQTGNILLVDGKVRLRGDRVQLVCEHVRYYQIEETRGGKGMAASPQGIITSEIEEINTKVTSVNTQRLVIHLKQTSNKTDDITSLHKITNILRDFPGYNEVNLMIDNEKKVFKLRLSGILVDYSPELHRRMVEVIGEDKVRLETKDD